MEGDTAALLYEASGLSSCEGAIATCFLLSFFSSEELIWQPRSLKQVAFTNSLPPTAGADRSVGWMLNAQLLCTRCLCFVLQCCNPFDQREQHSEAKPSCPSMSLCLAILSLPVAFSLPLAF